MKEMFLLAMVLIPYINGFSQCADPANIYPFEYDSKTYEVVMELKTWDDAAACSKERGGYLVEINSAEEQNTVFDSILIGAGVSPTYVEIFNGGGIAYIWIGATDKNEEGTWLWDGDDNTEGIHFWSGQGANGDNDGAPVENAYVNWGGSSAGTINEPDNYGGGGQDNAAIGLTGWPAGSTALGSPGEWNDIVGSSELYFVIEYDTIITGLNNFPDHPDNQINVRVYPNPTTGIIHVDVEDLLYIETFDISGRRRGSYNHSPVDLGHYEKGLYFLKIKTQTQIYTRKFFIE